jgi:hypothetical protein
MTTTELRHCPECRDVTTFVTPECLDGHADCADLMCVDCGLALTGTWSVDAEVALPVAA